MGDLKATPGPFTVGYPAHGITGPMTPSVSGPTVAGREWGYQIVTSGQRTLAIVPNVAVVGRSLLQEENAEEAQANAQLFAAAHELYGALANLLSVEDGDTEHRLNAQAYALSALAKARGEQPQSIREGMDRD